MRQLSEMELADAEIRHYKATGKGLVSFNTPQEALDALDSL